MNTHTSNAKHHSHTVPLWGLFLALLALTAAEVGLFEVWHRTAQAGDPFIPKLAMVILLLVFTLPKAAIVMIYFMHLKFEKQIIITLAIVPFLLAIGAVCAVLSDSLVLRPKAYNIMNTAAYDPHGEAESRHSQHSQEEPPQAHDAGAENPH